MPILAVISKAYLEAFRTSKMEGLVKIVNGFYALPISAKASILDV